MNPDSVSVGTVRVAFCYPLVNAYMAACWRALSRYPCIDLLVIGFQSGSTDMVNFNAGIMDGIPCRLLEGDERSDKALAGDIVAEFQPHVLFISGWSNPPFRKLYFDSRLRGVPKVLIMDNQLRRDFRQFIGSFLLKPILGKVDRVFVTGERAWQFARYLGFSEEHIHRGCVSIDYSGLSKLYQSRREAIEGWPKKFLFAGRYHERKALDILVRAYSRYRERVGDPWELIAVGTGPEADLLEGVEGISNLGFVQPQEMDERWLSAGVFVIPSRFDAWPLVVLEAAAAGLPVIASEACGSTVENVHHLFNGYIVPTENVSRLAEALMFMHENHDKLPVLGSRSNQLAAAYGADIWVDRVIDIVESLLDTPLRPKACE